MSNQIVVNESNKENAPENEEKKIPIFSIESILFILANCFFFKLTIWEWEIIKQVFLFMYKIKNRNNLCR